MLYLKIFVALVSLVVTIISTEITLRFIGPDYYQFNNQSAEYYTNPRGYHTPIRKEENKTIYGLHYQESKDGYRIGINESSAELPDDAISILGLGDSFTYGRGVKYKDLYLTKLRKSLNAEQDQYSVKNCGKAGANIDEIINTYNRESKNTDHSIVLYSFVLNDFGLPDKEQIVGLDFIDINNGQYTFNPLRQKSRLYNLFCYFAESYRINKITVNAYENAFKGEHGRSGFGKLKQLNKSVNSNNSKLAIVLFPLIYDFDNYRFNDIHEKIKDFCIKENIPVLDLLSVFSKHKAQQLWANPTDHHPNELAHNIAAKEVLRFLKDKQLLD